jgi:hypothetical protein
MPAYYAICYVSWHLAHIVLDKFDSQADRLQTWAVPVLAGFIMVMWDMSMGSGALHLGRGLDLARRWVATWGALRELYGLVPVRLHHLLY